MIKQLENFRSIDPFTLKENIFDMLNEEWMLITAGDSSSFNTMTASWGSFGVLWRKPISIIYVRPQRHTFQFTEKFNTYSLSFFGQNNFRKELSFCGSKSGRDFDKPKETGLTPAFLPTGSIAFQEARLIFDCRMMYADNIKPDNFIDMGVDQSVYPTKDYHRFYIGEIVGCFESNR